MPLIKSDCIHLNLIILSTVSQILGIKHICFSNFLVLSILSDDFCFIHFSFLHFYIQAESDAGENHVMVRFVPLSCPDPPSVGPSVAAGGLSVSLVSSFVCSQQ